MPLPFGSVVYRDRRPMLPDPYRPGHMVPGSFDDPAASVLRIPGGFVGSSSSVPSGDAARSDVLTAKSLYCDPKWDVRIGDRIRVGSEVWYVNAETSADVNPFTGWQPIREIPLDRTLG
jgi:hypothetical protein